MRSVILKIALAFAIVGIAGLLFTPRFLPMVLERHRSDLRFRAASDQRQLFVTIDDAPSTQTPAILRVLERHGVRATFFVISDRVRDPRQLNEIREAGHALGNHLQTTRAASKLTLNEFRHSFDHCAATLAPHTPSTKLFRPASDFGTREQVAYARAQGAVAVMGTVFPLDHWIGNPRWLARLARWLAIPGGILILHDGQRHGAITAETLDVLLPQLKADGYTFARLEDSWQNQ